MHSLFFFLRIKGIFNILLRTKIFYEEKTQAFFSNCYLRFGTF